MTLPLSREGIAVALLNQLTSSFSSGFTANVTEGENALTNVSSLAGLFAGFPLSAPGIPDGATIAAPCPTSGSSLSFLGDPATASGSGVSIVTGFRTGPARRATAWVQTPDQPALFIRKKGEEVPGRRVPGIPPRITLDYEVWLYSNAGQDTDAIPEAALNYLVDALEQVLKPPPGLERQTLGGLVRHCWIEGRAEFYPGDLASQAIAIVPVRILAPIIV